MQKSIFIIIFYFSIIFGAPSIHPMAKSLLIPGWGESGLGNQKSSRFFMQTEAILFTSCWSAYKLAGVKEKEYIAYANEHSGAKNTNDHRYWVDIGNYNSNDDFDEAKDKIVQNLILEDQIDIAKREAEKARFRER